MRLLNILLILFLLLGCSGPVTYSKLSSENYPPVSVDNVEVYIDEKPTKDFKKIALISTNLWKENFATNIQWLKQQGADLGADAIILLRADPHSSGGSLVAGPVGESFMALGTSGTSGYNYSAYAIKFLKN